MAHNITFSEQYVCGPRHVRAANITSTWLAFISHLVLQFHIFCPTQRKKCASISIDLHPSVILKEKWKRLQDGNSPWTEIMSVFDSYSCFMNYQLTLIKINNALFCIQHEGITLSSQIQSCLVSFPAVWAVIWLQENSEKWLHWQLGGIVQPAQAAGASVKGDMVAEQRWTQRQMDGIQTTLYSSSAFSNCRTDW